MEKKVKIDDNQRGDNEEVLSEKKNTAECCVCGKCITGMIVQALGKNWHPIHFTCFKCKEPITGNKFNVHDGNPYCENDFAHLFLAKCFGCNQPIRDMIVMAMGQTWHADHFVCCTCGKKLANQPYYEREANAFCTTCYEDKFCPRCSLCNKPILDTAVMALGNFWHQECFKCSNCDQPINDTSFELYKDKSVCNDCAKILKKLKIDTTGC